MTNPKHTSARIRSWITRKERYGPSATKGCDLELVKAVSHETRSP